MKDDMIKTLIEKAEVDEWDTNDYNGAPEYRGKVLDERKFAELVVLKVLDQIQDMRFELPDFVIAALEKEWGTGPLTKR